MKIAFCSSFNWSRATIMPVGARDFFLQNVQTGSGAHPVHYSIGTGSPPPWGVKWPGGEVNHSSPSSAEVKNEWSYTPVPPMWLHGVGRKSLPFVPVTCILNWASLNPVLVDDRFRLLYPDNFRQDSERTIRDWTRWLTERVLDLPAFETRSSFPLSHLIDRTITAHTRMNTCGW
jgi:hypothetical protein